MLRELRIKNFTIIDDLSIRFEEGLTVLTGETGAGKSIVVDALGLALGERAQTEMIKSGKDEATVEAFFEAPENQMLGQMGLDSDNGIVIRRNISSSGKSRAYINDTMVNLQSLSDIGKSLVDMHSQHEHQSLLSADNQMALLDLYGKLQNEKSEVKELFSSVQALQKELAALTTNIKERAARIDLLNFQINEINAAGLKLGEKESLEEERKILANLAKLNELTDSAYKLLYESEGSCVEKLSSVVSKLKEMSLIDSAINETFNLLDSAMPLVEDSALSLRGFKEKYDIDPKRLDSIEERLEDISKLGKKYGGSITAVLKYEEDAEKELATLGSSDEKVGITEKELKEKEAVLLRAAAELSSKRKKVAEEVSKAVVKILKELALEKAEFKAEVKSAPLSADGFDAIEFMFSANPGEPVKSLSKVASGGELSRVMLAIKSILADVDKIPVLIFDEIDAGIGGRTAESVGLKLKNLGKTHQVICITHLPQIASAANLHLMTEKLQKKDSVSVKIKELSKDERKTEIARMLSGKITEVSLKHAGELLAGHSRGGQI